jgi:hypothetical protein
MIENSELKQRVRELEQVEAEPCPKCRKRTWELQRSKPDEIFGRLGGIRRIYRCADSACGYSEEKLIQPSGTTKR